MAWQAGSKRSRASARTEPAGCWELCPALRTGQRNVPQQKAHATRRCPVLARTTCSCSFFFFFFTRFCPGEPFVQLAAERGMHAAMAGWLTASGLIACKERAMVVGSCVRLNGGTWQPHHAESSCNFKRFQCVSPNRVQLQRLSFDFC